MPNHEREDGCNGDQDHGDHGKHALPRRNRGRYGRCSSGLARDRAGTWRNIDGRVGRRRRGSAHRGRPVLCRLNQGVQVGDGKFVVSHLVIRFGIDEGWSLETGRHYGDVVRATAGICLVDEPSAQRRDVGLLVHYARNLLVAHDAGESVAAQHQGITAPQGLMCHVHTDHALGPQRLQDDVTAVAHLSFLGRDLPGINQALHE